MKTFFQTSECWNCGEKFNVINPEEWGTRIWRKQSKLLIKTVYMILGMLKLRFERISISYRKSLDPTVFQANSAEQH